MRVLYIGLLALLLSGCQAILTKHFKSDGHQERCFATKFTDQLESSCDLTPWIDYWVKVSQLDWNTRQQKLATLTSIPVDRVKMILLSHVPNTPYQSRLRAQLVAQQFVKYHQGMLADFIHHIVFLPAQKKLELESALKTQTQFNIDQEKQLQTQAEKMLEQEQQMNKLLQIEKTLLTNQQKPNHE